MCISKNSTLFYSQYLIVSGENKPVEISIVICTYCMHKVLRTRSTYFQINIIYRITGTFNCTTVCPASNILPRLFSLIKWREMCRILFHMIDIHFSNVTLINGLIIFCQSLLSALTKTQKLINRKLYRQQIYHLYRNSVF